MNHHRILSLPVFALTVSALALFQPSPAKAEPPRGPHDKASRADGAPGIGRRVPGGPTGERAGLMDGWRGGGPLADRPTTAILEAMSRRLELTDDQKAKILPILENTRTELRKTADGTKAILEKSKEDVAAILTPEQKARMDKMKENLAGAVSGFVREHGPEMKDRARGAHEEIALRTAMVSLQLTDEQRAKLKELQQTIRTKREAIEKELQPRMEELRTEVKQALDQTLTEEQKGTLKEKLENLRPDGERDRGPADKKGKEPRHGRDRKGPGSRDTHPDDGGTTIASVDH